MQPTAAEPPSDPTRIAGKVLGWATLATVAVVAATGVWLYRYYVPSSAGRWPFGASHVQMSDWFRLAHRWSAELLLVLSLLWLVLAVVRLARKVAAPRAVGLGLSLVGVGAVMAARLTGWLLPWDQLALWAVKIEQDMRGYRFLWRNDIRFVILGGREIGLDQLQRAFVVHALVLPAVLLLVALGFAWSWRRGRPGDDDQPDQVASATDSSRSTESDAAASAWRA